jgi:hypothetical protein
MDILELEWVDVDWISLAQDSNRWRALVNSVLNLRFDEFLGNYRVSKQLVISGVVLSAIELVSLTVIFRNSRRMRWTGHVTRMGEKRDAYSLFVGKPEGKRPLGRPRRT